MKELLLSGKYANGRVALVDDDLFAELNHWRWRVNEKGYVSRASRRNGKPVVYKLHRVVTRAAFGQAVDHINRDKLDNRRQNLRLATISQNNANAAGRRPGYIGVYYDPSTNKTQPWVAKAYVQGATICLGYYDTPQEAAYVRDQATLQLFGDFATPNLL